MSRGDFHLAGELDFIEVEVTAGKEYKLYITLAANLGKVEVLCYYAILVGKLDNLVILTLSSCKADMNGIVVIVGKTLDVDACDTLLAEVEAVELESYIVADMLNRVVAYGEGVAVDVISVSYGNCKVNLGGRLEEEALEVNGALEYEFQGVNACKHLGKNEALRCVVVPSARAVILKGGNEAFVAVIYVKGEVVVGVVIEPHLDFLGAVLAEVNAVKDYMSFLPIFLGENTALKDALKVAVCS